MQANALSAIDVWSGDICRAAFSNQGSKLCNGSLYLSVISVDFSHVVDRKLYGTALHVSPEQVVADNTTTTQQHSKLHKPSFSHSLL